MNMYSLITKKTEFWPQTQIQPMG